MQTGFGAEFAAFVLRQNMASGRRLPKAVFAPFLSYAIPLFPL